MCLFSFAICKIFGIFKSDLFFFSLMFIFSIAKYLLAGAILIFIFYAIIFSIDSLSDSTKKVISTIFRIIFFIAGIIFAAIQWAN